MSIRRIRRAVREDHYEFTIHALEEMDEDDLTDTDVRQTLLQGRVVARLSDDPRGIRFVVRGTPKDGVAEIEVVCRFLPSSLLRIITAYVLEE